MAPRRFLTTTALGATVACVALGCSSAPWSKSKDPGFNEYTQRHHERSIASPGLGVSGEKSGWDKFAEKTKPSSIGKSIGNGYQSAKAKVASWGTDDENPDPISLSREAKASPALFVAAAQLNEQQKNIQSAIENYERALRMEPKNRDALLGYAHLMDRLGRGSDAQRLYEQAASAHPRDARVLNDLAIYYARNGMLDQAVVHLERTVELEPTRVLYRNNLATVLVEQGRNQDALNHLAAVHGEPIAHYNLGHLLVKAGQPAAARDQFIAALQQEPDLNEAHAWIAHLDRQGSAVGPDPHNQMARAPAVAMASDSTGAAPPWRRAAEPQLPAPPAQGGVVYPTQMTQAASAEGAGPPQWPSQTSDAAPAWPPTPDQVRDLPAPRTDPAEIEPQSRNAMRPLPSINSAYYPPSRF